MEEQKKLSVRDVLWRKKRARDKVLDAVGKLCDEAWAVVDKITAERRMSRRRGNLGCGCVHSAILSKGSTTSTALPLNCAAGTFI